LLYGEYSVEPIYWMQVWWTDSLPPRQVVEFGFCKLEKSDGRIATSELNV
jgi:hypothetical protein